MIVKKVLSINWLGTLLLNIFFLFSCATATYDFIGAWNIQPDNLTYVNYDQHIKIRLPNKEWEVYTEPTNDLEELWIKPTESRPSYTVLIANFKLAAVQLIIEPNPLDIDLDFYLEKTASKYKGPFSNIKFYKNEVVERNNRLIGITLQKHSTQVNLDFKGLAITFKEPGRFTLLAAACPENVFELMEDQFWSIVDSYEYLE